MPFSDLMQVFDNELGLYLSTGYYVAPISYRSEAEYRQTRDQFQEVAHRGTLECSASPDWTLSTPLGSKFRQAEPGVAARILEARDHLLHRLDLCGGSGHEAGLVIIRLR